MSVETYTAAKVKVGFFSMLALAIFVGFLFWVSGGRDAGLFAPPRQTVIVPFEDISGLRPNAPVTIGGQQVGSVVRRQLDGTLVVLTMEIDRRIDLYENARFSIFTPSLFSGAEVALDPGGPREEMTVAVDLMTPEETVVHGERTQAIRFDVTHSRGEVGMAELTARSADTVEVVNDILVGFREDQDVMQHEVNRVMERTASLLEKLDEGLEPERVEATAENIEALTEHLRLLVEENRATLNQLTENLNQTVEATNEQIQARGDEVGELVQTMTRSIEESVAPLIEQSERLTASLERIAGDNEPLLYDTMLSVRDAVTNLEAFTARIRANPSLLIFGTGDEPPERTAPRPRFDRNLRDRGRQPLYDKRDR